MLPKDIHEPKYLATFVSRQPDVEVNSNPPTTNSSNILNEFPTEILSSIFEYVSSNYWENSLNAQFFEFLHLRDVLKESRQIDIACSRWRAINRRLIFESVQTRSGVLLGVDAQDIPDVINTLPRITGLVVFLGDPTDLHHLERTLELLQPYADKLDCVSALEWSPHNTPLPKFDDTVSLSSTIYSLISLFSPTVHLEIPEFLFANHIHAGIDSLPESLRSRKSVTITCLSPPSYDSETARRANISARALVYSRVKVFFDLNTPKLPENVAFRGPAPPTSPRTVVHTPLSSTLPFLLRIANNVKSLTMDFRKPRRVQSSSPWPVAVHECAELERFAQIPYLNVATDAFCPDFFARHNRARRQQGKLHVKTSVSHCGMGGLNYGLRLADKAVELAAAARTHFEGIENGWDVSIWMMGKKGRFRSVVPFAPPCLMWGGTTVNDFGSKEIYRYLSLVMRPLENKVACFAHGEAMPEKVEWLTETKWAQDMKGQDWTEWLDGGRQIQTTVKAQKCTV